MDRVKVVEVGPRDGLQNETTFISTEEKIGFIKALIETGLSEIEITSFVSPKKIPQLADHVDVMQAFREVETPRLSVLVPNLQGFERALNVGAKHIAVFAGVSETFSKKNINATIDESMARYKEVCEAAIQAGLSVRGYLSCCWGCPYEGAIAESRVVELAERLLEFGCYEVSFGDTIGVATANKSKALIKFLQQSVPTEKIAVHFHDTYGQAIANVYAALEEGVRTVDSSVAGLGGCPYAKGATGNVASEDIIYLLHGMGFETGVDLHKLAQVGRDMSKRLERFYQAKVGQVL